MIHIWFLISCQLYQSEEQIKTSHLSLIYEMSLGISQNILPKKRQDQVPS